MAGRKQNAPAWIEAFLRALARTGNARLAAVEAGVDHSTAYQRRLKHPDFAAAWARVLEERDPSTIESAFDGPPPQPAAGAELVERVSARHGPQIVRAGVGRWSKRGEDAFLTELAASANVQRACAAAGFSTTTLYKRRLANRIFADAWDSALAIGGTRIEAYLIEAADRTFDPGCLPIDGAALPTMTIAEAIATLRLLGRGHRPGGGKAGGGRDGGGDRGWLGDPEWETAEGEAELDQLREGILGKLEKLHARCDEEKRAAGWTRQALPPSADGPADGQEWAWVPPGWAPVVDAKALPAIEADAAGPDQGIGGDEPLGPSIRRL